jgi:hypothetical protein
MRIDTGEKEITDADADHETRHQPKEIALRPGARPERAERE